MENFAQIRAKIEEILDELRVIAGQLSCMTNFKDFKEIEKKKISPDHLLLRVEELNNMLG